MEVLYRDFKSSHTQAYGILENDLRGSLIPFKKYFDIQQFYFYSSTAQVNSETLIPIHARAILQCIMKSSHLIFSSNELILRGDFGAARILSRETIEYLLIGKFLFYQNEFADKWLNGDEFKTGSFLFNRLQKPDPKKNLQPLWGLLCKQAHAKTSSFQIGIKDNDIDDIQASFIVNSMLLRCKEHLVSLFISEICKVFPQNQVNNVNLTSDSVKIRPRIDEIIEQIGLDFIKDYWTDWKMKNSK